MFDAKVSNGLELGFGKDFAHGIVPGPCLVRFRRCSRKTYGVLSMIIFVLGVMAFSTSAMFIDQSPAEDTSVAPFLGGWRGA